MTPEERAVLEEIQKLNNKAKLLWDNNASTIEIEKHNKKWNKVMCKLNKLLEETE